MRCGAPAHRDRLIKNGDLKLDERDLRILTILQKEGRIMETELAELPGTVQRIPQQTEA